MPVVFDVRSARFGTSSSSFFRAGLRANDRVIVASEVGALRGSMKSVAAEIARRRLKKIFSPLLALCSFRRSVNFFEIVQLTGQGCAPSMLTAILCQGARRALVRPLLWSAGNAGQWVSVEAVKNPDLQNVQGRGG